MMDISGAGLSAGNSAHQQTSKRKFFQWAVKWFYTNMSEDTQEKPDVPLLATLLQSIGFQLREFDKSEETCAADGTRAKSDTIKVVLECGNSGMRACLELEDVKCQCPDPEDTKDASFWSVSGTGPANATTVDSANKIEESGSNLLPLISKDKAKMINDVIYHLLHIISDKSVADINQNSKSRSNLNLSRVGNSKDPKNHVNEFVDANNSMSFVRSRTQPEIVLNSGGVSTRKTLRQFNKETCPAEGETIDIECGSIDRDQPRPSPPKIPRSPVFIFNDLCSSLDSISVQSEEDTGNLTTHLVRAHRSLEMALEIIAGRNSPIPGQTTLLKSSAKGSNLTFEDSVRKKSSNSTSNLKISPSGANSRPGSSCSMPSRGYAALSLPKNTLSSSAPKSPPNRRSAGSTSRKIPTIPKITATVAASGTANKNPQQIASGASKIPGRRKSFHSLGTLKLAAVNAKNTAVAAQKNSTSPTLSNERFNAGACQSAISKVASSLNQSSTIPTLKVAPLKPPGPKDTKETARRSLGNPRFGYGSKKT